MVLKVQILALVFLAACIGVSWSRAVSSINLAGMRIYTDGKELHCDSLVCPATAENCIITKKNDEKDSTKIETWKRCTDKDNKIIAEDKQYSISENPNEYYNLHIESGRDGSIANLNSSEAKKIADEVMKDVRQSMEKLELELRGLWNSFI